ncbi:hypothetical protein DLJ53_05945 [Acuticoccus sediminis]|uniref:Uncharacterized protein n=1 Tax=Acuticoccus sediminis TaxID=2184697 RepID=A0A8B2NXA8_9HYPH|nr:hypothetical protein [Acuticoccus sediminis]RAI04003.1 hypothetical protein DLJ53_05945 [Acuticoccus sediminis]
MPRRAFGRLARPVATAILVCPAIGTAFAFAYAPVAEAPEAPEQLELHATIGPMRPTTGAKSALPDRLKPTVNKPEAVEEGIEEDPHSVEQEAIPVPPEGRASIGDVVWGDETLPPEVARTRTALLDAARTGDVEALRPIFSGQDLPPVVSSTVPVDDPVDFLKTQSGDPEGREILAILTEILETGHVFIEGDGTYVWPYFAEVPLEELKPPHFVELYRILTAIDVEEMERQGRYTFFRVGITKTGRLRYFTAGDVE